MKGFALVLLPALVLGCSSDASETSGDVASSEQFVGGQFQLKVHRVTDGCLDGSVDLLFMPEGTGEPYPLKNTTWIPGEADVPMTYQMDLEAPFSDMTITMSASDQGYRIADGTQTGVVLGLAGSGDCSADMRFEGDVVLHALDSVSMTVRVELSDFTSANEECPKTSAPTCQVVLEMSGARQ